MLRPASTDAGGGSVSSSFSPAAVAADLNRRWLLGAPDAELTNAGVVMHVLDAGGDMIHYARSQPLEFPSLNASLRPQPTSRNYERLVASLVNKLHPNVYRCDVCNVTMRSLLAWCLRSPAMTVTWNICRRTRSCS